jgi:hypothetical protein
MQFMSADSQGYYLPPDVPVPQVQLEMPQQRSVRAVVDRMKGEAAAQSQ